MPHCIPQFSMLYVVRFLIFIPTKKKTAFTLFPTNKPCTYNKINVFLKRFASPRFRLGNAPTKNDFHAVVSICRRERNERSRIQEGIVDIRVYGNINVMWDTRDDSSRYNRNGHVLSPHISSTRIHFIKLSIRCDR